MIDRSESGELAVRRGRSRGRRLGVLALVALLVATSSMAWAARAKVRVLRPAASICGGGTITVGVKKKGKPPKYVIKVINPAGKVIWTRKGKAVKKWRKWRVRLRALGTHRIVYKTYRKKTIFRIASVLCTDESKVFLTSDTADVTSLSLDNAGPGDTAVGCIRVSYSGSLSSQVRLYGSTTGTGLDPYLEMTD